MADSPGQRLAGTLGPRFRQAMAVPQEDISVKLARLLQGGGGTPADTPTPGYQMPFAGLRNAPQALPPFVPPGNAMTEAVGPGVPFTPPAAPQPPQAPVVPAPTTAVQPALQPPAAPAMPDATAVPPMPAPTTVQGDVASAVQQLIDARLLPEQWRGSFVNRFGGNG